MPRSIPVPVRWEIVERHRDRKESLRSIACLLGLSEDGVRKIWRQYRDEGDVAPRYSRCGQREHEFSRLAYRGALTLKRRHPTWGAGYIIVCLRERWPDLSLPSERTVQRWFRKAGLTPLRSVGPPQQRRRGKQPHEVWEVDATEQVKIEGDTQASWLSCVDEATGAVLTTAVFSPRALAERSAVGGAGSVEGGFSPMGSSATFPC